MLIMPTLEIKYPMALERRYAKELRSYVRAEMAIVREYKNTIVASIMANSIRVDAEEPEDDDDWIALLLAMIFGEVAKRTRIQYRVEKIFEDVLRYTTTQYARIHQSTFGDTPQPIPSSASEAAAVKKMKDMFIYQNLTLIKSVDDEIREGLYYALFHHLN